MRKLKFGGLMAFAFGLAVLLGNSAFSAAASATRYYTPDGMGGYQDVTTIVQQESYQCNSSENECLVQFSNDDPQTGNKILIESGVFEELP